MGVGQIALMPDLTPVLPAITGSPPFSTQGGEGVNEFVQAKFVWEGEAILFNLSYKL